MNHRVPDLEFDGDYSFPSSSSSSLTRAKKSAMAEEDIMELLWQNGQVVAQSQNQRSARKSSDHDEAVVIPDASAREMRSAAEEAARQDHLFMREDEMASWLHYPLDDSSYESDMYTDLFYPLPPPPQPAISAAEGNTAVTAPGPAAAREVRLSTSVEIHTHSQTESPSHPMVLAPRPPVRREEVAEASPRLQNFMLFSRLPTAAAESMRMESGPSSSSKAVKESTVVESNETPKVGPNCIASVSVVGHSPAPDVGCGTMSVNEPAGTSTTARELTTTSNNFDFTVTSSPGGSGGSVEPQRTPPQQGQKKPAAEEDRKRKAREADDNEGHSMDIEFESGEAKKQTRGSTSTKRSRAAEVHNLSERRRRDRINEKMKALQELIPRCNKSDKASMLDEAIEYLKALQLQVQMMSMGCNMVPMMYPGVQQYMPAMGLGMGMGMGMGTGMDLSMNRPILPYPQLLPGSTIPAAAHLAPRIPMPAFHVPPIVPDISRMQGSNAADPSSLSSPNPHQPRLPNFIDPYQQYLGPQQGQVFLPQQNQPVVLPSNEKPSSSREVGSPENHQPGG